MRLERTFFLHFGVTTFNEVEWGSGARAFALQPQQPDARQWLRGVKLLDGKMLVLVAGTTTASMWPTRHNGALQRALHCIQPRRGGKGRPGARGLERRARGRRHLCRLPRRLTSTSSRPIPKNPTPYYGNGSAKRPTTIPTDPAHFSTDPSRGRAPTKGFWQLPLRGR